MTYFSSNFENMSTDVEMTSTVETMSQPVETAQNVQNVQNVQDVAPQETSTPDAPAEADKKETTVEIHA